MTWLAILKAYADQNGASIAEVEKDVDEGWISKKELFDAWLEWEGIIHYTDKILSALAIIEEHTVN